MSVREFTLGNLRLLDGGQVQRAFDAGTADVERERNVPPALKGGGFAALTFPRGEVSETRATFEAALQVSPIPPLARGDA